MRPSFWQAMFSNHYVGWDTPLVEGVVRGVFWGNVIGWSVGALVLLVQG